MQPVCEFLRRSGLADVRHVQRVGRVRIAISAENVSVAIGGWQTFGHGYR